MTHPKGATPFKTTVAGDSSGGLTIKAAVTGKSLYITKLVISASDAGNYQVEDEDNTAALEQLYMPANSVFSATFDDAIELATGKALQMTGSVAGTATVTAVGYSL